MKCPNCGASTKRGICEYCGHDSQIEYQRELQSLDQRTNFERNADKIAEKTNVVYEDAKPIIKRSVFFAVFIFIVIAIIISFVSSGLCRSPDAGDKGRVENFTFEQDSTVGSITQFNYSGVFKNTGKSTIRSVTINIALKDGNDRVLSDTFELLTDIASDQQKPFTGFMIYSGNITGSPTVEVLNFEIR